MPAACRHPPPSWAASARGLAVVEYQRGRAYPPESSRISARRMLVAGLLLALAAPLAAHGRWAPAGGQPTPVMPNLLIPTWEPTYNLTKSTMTQLCFGPGMGAPILTNKTGAFLKSWGIVALDFETEEGNSQHGGWSQHRPKDADVMMVEQAAAMKQMAPDTQVWVYRNLVQPYANFVQLREKIEDPRYAGWFMHFDNTTNDEKLTPRCEANPRLNKTLCTDLFHTKLAWTENGHDCGDLIPCGDYVFDHRNQSLRGWIVNDYMMGPTLGMGNRSAMDGFMLDDNYNLWSGPSEVSHFLQGTGLTLGGQGIADLYGNWSLTTTASLAAVHKAGGYTWSNINCELDPLFGKSCDMTEPSNCTNATNSGYFSDSSVPSGRHGCGLTKTNASPRGTNRMLAPIWDGRSGNDQEKNETGQKDCALWLQEACDPSGVFGKIPTLLSFTRPSTPRRPHPAPLFPALLQDIARFMLVRGPYSWMGYGWEGCITTPPPVVAYDHDYGQPKGHCAEVSPGVFHRSWSKAEVTMDCNSFVANITLAGSDKPLA